MQIEVKNKKQEFFAVITDVNIKTMMFEQQMKAIEEDVLPFGFIDDGIAAAEHEEQQDEWNTKRWVEDWGAAY